MFGSGLNSGKWSEKEGQAIPDFRGLALRKHDFAGEAWRCMSSKQFEVTIITSNSYFIK